MTTLCKVDKTHVKLDENQGNLIQAPVSELVRGAILFSFLQLTFFWKSDEGAFFYLINIKANEHEFEPLQVNITIS